MNLVGQRFPYAAGMYKNANQQDEEPELKLQETSTRRDLISIYPNPFIDEVNIAYQLATGEDASLVLYDVLGKEIYREVLPANQYFQRINLKSIASGFYVYRISTASGELYIGKLQKQ